MTKWLRRFGIGLGVLLGVLALGVGLAIAESRSRLAERSVVTDDAVTVPTDEAGLAEGRRLFLARGCADCHGERGEGRVVMDDAPGRLVATNLTELPGRFDDADYVRAIRDGIAPDGRPLVFMPSNEYHGLSDRDVGALIAYLRALPPVTSALPVTEVRPLGHVLHVAGVFPLVPAERIDPSAQREPAPEPAPTAEYGRYLAVGCTGCHGEGLSGGPIPGAPPELGVPGNLTPHATGLLAWDEAAFVRAMRTGMRPDGTQLNPQQMPWRSLQHMTDVELQALYAYLRTVAPREAGTR